MNINRDAESIHVKDTPHMPNAVVRLAEAEAFVILVREVGLSDYAAIVILTGLKKRGIVVQYA